MANARPDTLYHYCSTHVALSILQHKVVWLSYLKLSNDTMEGKLLHNTLKLIAARDNLDLGIRSAIEQACEFIDQNIEGLGFCLSADGDVLSQWRGYADDGKGIAIGFNVAYLEQLQRHAPAGSDGFKIKRVEYAPDKHVDTVFPVYELIKKMVDEGAFELPNKLALLAKGLTAEEIKEAEGRYEARDQRLFLYIAGAMDELYSMKGSAFREEQEWRLISLVGGQQKCEYRSSANIFIPYKPLALFPMSGLPIINSIRLGPKHGTPLEVVKHMVGRLGYHNVNISRSDATYR